jgi:hypothetical protein
MLRVLGITGRPPHKENRIIFYSILFILIATLLYILSYYSDGERKENEGRKTPGTEKGSFLSGRKAPKSMIDKSFPFSWQER